MNWHSRYAQQASWTRDLRQYIFRKVDLENARRLLEVGCGTGAILSEAPAKPQVHGLDLDLDALLECRIHAPGAILTRGDALQLPYPNTSFDVVYCHFLLLWARDPLQVLREMKRVARKGGDVIAFAEPDYFARVDEPEELVPIGRWQTESLRRQGADPGIGARVAELFFAAGLDIVETGTIERRGSRSPSEEWEAEWRVLEGDLKGLVSDRDIQSMKQLDRQARRQKTRVLHVPTYFAWGRA